MHGAVFIATLLYDAVFNVWQFLCLKLSFFIFMFGLLVLLILLPWFTNRLSPCNLPCDVLYSVFCFLLLLLLLLLHFGDTSGAQLETR